MAAPTNRQEFKDFCLRQLGQPVIKVNVDDDQVDDCIDMAIQFMTDFHDDATERVYISHQVTGQDKANKYITLANNVTEVVRIFPVGSTNATMNMFDLRYQLRLHELYDFTSSSYVNYVITQQHIATLDMIFTGETPIRFNSFKGLLNIDWDWENAINTGEYIIMESYIKVDPDEFTRYWSDRMFKKLAIAYIKRQWGSNMKKYTGMQLPGGVQLDGQTLYNEALTDIAEVEAMINSAYNDPPQFYVG